MNGTDSYIRAKQFETVTFYDSKMKRQVIILYTLGEDGVIREFSNGKWTPFPIAEESAMPIEELKA